MAKEVFFSIAEPPSSALLTRWCDFLVTHAAKQMGYRPVGSVREKRPGETGPIQCQNEIGEEAS